MIKMTLLALLSQALLLVCGAAILQLISPERKLKLLESVPSAWGMGVAFLYLTGYACLKTGVSPASWKLIVLVSGAGLIAGASWRYAASKTDAPASPAEKNRPALPDLLFVFLILSKICLAAYILLNNPVIDSDATNPDRWIGLAKAIRWTGELPLIRDRLGPSLLPLWTSLFLPRWHDSLISLPWLFTYIAFIGAAFVTTRDITQHRTASLGVAYLFSALPLVITHVIRPGYSDFLLGFFVLFGLSPFITALYKGEVLFLRHLFTGISGCLLCAFTKNEGIAWTLLIGLIMIGTLSHSRYGVSWKKILKLQALFAGVCYLIYLASSSYLYEHTFENAGGHLKYVFQKTFDTKALYKFAEHAFLEGSFSLLWWLFIGGLILVFIKKTSAPARIAAAYCGSFFLAVFYIACFTGNVTSTLAGGNVARFLLQISGTALPVMAIAFKEFNDTFSDKPGTSTMVSHS